MLLEIVAVFASSELARIGEHRANLTQLRVEREAARTDADAAADMTDRIDREWIDYDVRLGRLELAISDASANVPDARASLRERLTDQLAPPGPDTVLMQATGPIVGNALFVEKRDVFLSVYRGFHAQLVELSAMLAHDAGRGNVSPPEVNAMQNLIAAESNLARRWAAISITAKSFSDQANRYADEVQAGLDAERGANLIQQSLAP